ncbi:M23 family metallopeptidase [Arachnia propionica]|uniref:M23 family metallopeptidase n=1 Tax=Arachnia propionica TaxID=1750 RepID=UPI00163AC7C0|nr:M23 family metallopeptidase [Arachnia propionica]
MKQLRPLVAAVSAVLFVAGTMSISLWGSEPDLHAIPEVTEHSDAVHDVETPAMGSGDGALLLVSVPTTPVVDQLPTADTEAEAPGEDTTVLNVPSAIPTETLDLVDVDGGKLLAQPVRGRFTSRFGMRFHPVLRVWKPHTGLDFAAPCGAPVGASAPGTVIGTGWAGGNGVQVKIDHGRIAGHHVVTTYNHLSSVAVTVGQRVTTHQGVGRVGNTGYSTGCHLHFEVIVDGTFQNPEAWLNGVPAVDASFAATPSTLPTPASTAPKGSSTTPAPVTSTKPAPPGPAPSTSAPRTSSQSGSASPSAPATSRTPSPSPSVSESATKPSAEPSTGPGDSARPSQGRETGDATPSGHGTNGTTSR